jgi:MarR family transcriptional regulator for hemolysin
MEPPLGRRLYLGHRAVHDVLDARLSDEGANLWSWIVLREAALAGGVCQRELAGRIGIEPPTLVRHLDRLASDGYVERRPDPADRRALRIVVTASGKRRLAALQKVATDLDAELRSLLTEPEVELVGKALLRIADHFDVVGAHEDAMRRMRRNPPSARTLRARRDPNEGNHEEAARVRRS